MANLKSPRGGRAQSGRPARTQATAPKKSPAKAEEPREGERLQKILAAAGIASRRKAEEIILEGRVQVNGQIVTEMGTRVDPLRDHVRVDGKLLQGAERPRYYMLNKPKGYVTTVSDPEGRHTVMEFFRGSERIYPVGRLDYASEGLLLMTNDGALAHTLTRAASHVEKVYLVKVSGRPTEDELDQIRAGIMIDRGRPGEGRVMTAPAAVQMVRNAENPWFELTLIEGRNREIRKMFEEIGHFVEKIRRVGFGPLVLDVEPGEFRELTDQEVEALRRAGQRKHAPKPSTTLGSAKTRRTRSIPAAPLPKTRPARTGSNKRSTSSTNPRAGSNDRRPTSGSTAPRDRSTGSGSQTADGKRTSGSARPRPTEAAKRGSGQRSTGKPGFTKRKPSGRSSSR